MNARIFAGSVGVVTLDDVGCVQAFDEVAATLFGYDAAEVVGRNVALLLAEPFPAQPSHLVGTGREVAGRRKDGSAMPVWLAVNAIAVGEGRTLVASFTDLTAWKKVADELACVLEMNRGMRETTHQPIITIHANGAIHSFNPAAVRLFGYQADEVLGQNVNMLMPEPVHAEHDGDLSRYLREGDPRVIGAGREFTGRNRSGALFPMQLAVGVMEMAGARMFVGVITDLTERRQVEEELHRHRDHLEELVAIATTEVKAIVQSAVNAVITIDSHGIIRTFNPSAEKMLGWSREDAVGRNVSILMEEPIASQHDGYLARFFATREPHIIGLGREVTARRKDGTSFPAHLAVGHLELSDGRHIFVGFLSDITPQKRNETELKLAKEEAEAGARAKAAFVANMSHEIRTPMNAILGFADVVLQDRALAPETRRHVKTILSSAKSLLGIINDVLDVTKLESGKLTLETVCFHLPNVLAETLRTVEHRAAEKHLDLRVEYDDALPSRCLGDPTRLRQVVLNLVGNAIKFTEQGSVTVVVESGRQQGFLHFSVIDTGIGMTREQTAKVFDAFSQADVSTTRRFGGTGLGTTISKQIVELMKGEIWVESEPGQGSVFHFTAHLPPAPQIQGCLYEDGDAIEEGYLSPRLFQILLAEDIEVNATLALLRLRQQGHAVTWAKNGLEVVDHFVRGGFDLILMDLMMPELDGFETTRIIRRMERDTSGHIPILALTASVMHKENDACMAVGMDGVEAKPIDFFRLLTTMEQLVPKGSGQPNTLLPDTPRTGLALDLSPLNGVVAYQKALRTWRDATAYVKALVSFAAGHGLDADRIARLLTTHPRDQASARFAVHALKGVAGNLAVERVARVATALESELKAGNLDAAHAHLPPLRHALEAVTVAIGRLHAVPEERSPPLHPVDAATLQGCFGTLLKALETLNPDVVEPVMAILARHLPQQELLPIQQCVDRFDFEAATVRAQALADRVSLKV
ncbi:MAG: PAS domain S-box protein [Magnetococcales bacterium]|nr:PAS domain S-box protein [Magnetococcales bacterium]